MKKTLGPLETRLIAYAQMRRLSVVRLGELAELAGQVDQFIAQFCDPRFDFRPPLIGHTVGARLGQYDVNTLEGPIAPGHPRITTRRVIQRVQMIRVEARPASGRLDASASRRHIRLKPRHQFHPSFVHELNARRGVKASVWIRHLDALQPAERLDSFGYLGQIGAIVNGGKSLQKSINLGQSLLPLRRGGIGNARPVVHAQIFRTPVAPGRRDATSP